MIQVQEYASFCEKGSRGNNEDFICLNEGQDRIFVLCDGMGGHGHGEIASETVGTSVFRYLRELQMDEYTPDMLQEALDFAVEQLNRVDIYNDERRMGTTLVVVVLNHYDVLVGHVGDSRCYLLDGNGNKKFRTRDHSVVAEAVENEILTEEEAFTSPKKNILTRSVQAGKDQKIEITVDVLPSVDEGDYLLMCTDGVNDALRDSEIEIVLSEGTVEERISRLKEDCAYKSHDNYSAIFLRLHLSELRPSVAVPVYYCTMCGMPVTGNAVLCIECEQKRLNEESESSQNHSKAGGKPTFKGNYFPKEKIDNPEDYIDFGCVKIKKKVYVWGSSWAIISLIVICLILSITLLRVQSRKKETPKQIILLNEPYKRLIIGNENSPIDPQKQDPIGSHFLFNWWKYREE